MAEQMTEAQLYDLLQRWFGIGSYDELDEKEPWYKARATEIGKLKRLMKSRHMSVEQMVEAAKYCHERHLPVNAAWQVVEAYSDARRAAREAAATSRGDRVQNAIAAAVAAGETAWAERLAASGSAEVLEAWEASRG